MLCRSGADCYSISWEHHTIVAKLMRSLGLLVSTSHPVHSPAAQASTPPPSHLNVSTSRLYRASTTRALWGMHVKQPHNDVRCALVAGANLFQCRWLCHL